MDSQALMEGAEPARPQPAGPPRAADPRSLTPRPLTARQERFCHYFVAYANAAHAARQAGFSPHSAKHQGYRLLRTGRVRQRIRRLHAELARDHAADADALIGKLENLYRRAVAAGRFMTATRAVELQARLVALKDRRQGPPPLPAPALPVLERPAPADGPVPAMPMVDLAADPALAEFMARARAQLRKADETDAEGASASVGMGGHSVGIRSTGGSAKGSAEVGARSADE